MDKHLLTAIAGRHQNISAGSKTGPDKRQEKSLSLLESIVESSEDAIASICLNGIITSWNQGAERMFGYSANEAIGQPFSICIPPNCADEEIEIRRCIQRGEHLSGYETIRRCKDGSLLNVSVSASPMKDGQGRIVGASGIIRNITERKRLERELQQSRDKLQAQAEVMELASLLARDAEGRITFWSRGSERMYGWSRSEALGQVSHTLLKTVFSEPREQIEARLRSGQPWQGEVVHTKRDGTQITVASQWVPYFNAAGQVVAIVEGNNDISERKQAEQILLRQSQRLELLSETAAFLLFTDKPATAIQAIFQKLKEQIQVDVYFNFLINDSGDAMWLHSFGGITDEAAQQISRLEFGQAVCGTVAVERRPLAFTNVQESDVSIVQLVKDFGVRAYVCNPILAGDRFLGTLSFGSCTKDAFAEEELELFRTISRYLALALDRWRLLKEVTQRADELEMRVAERTVRLEESMESLEGLLYHVAHNLRAPLRAMHSFTQLLVEDYAPRVDGVGEDYAQRIVEASAKMDMLIRDLLHYGRLGHQTISWTDIDSTKLIDGILAGLHEEVTRKKVEIEVDKPLPNVWGDRRILEQVLMSLVDNALKFVRPGITPRIHIWATTGPETVRLHIEDNGIGIEPGYQERIFWVFERLHSDDIYPGTGIGLAIVKKGMERLQGSIGLKSQPNVGSCFWLELKPASQS